LEFDDIVIIYKFYLMIYNYHTCYLFFFEFDDIIIRGGQKPVTRPKPEKLSAKTDIRVGLYGLSSYRGECFRFLVSSNGRARMFKVHPIEVVNRLNSCILCIHFRFFIFN